MPFRRRLEVTGIVQGVGFRPFVYNLAREHGLTGSVHNHSAGVTIEAEGDCQALDCFERELFSRQPPLAAIDQVKSEEIPCIGDAAFVIDISESANMESTPVPSDIATCYDCLRELNDAQDRRFGYPFINCTNCGPRFTIIRDLPYDRPATTMAAFQMCSDCEAEYHDPGNRRFHAQPNACAACGPQISMEISEVSRLFDNGAIVAVKGIGGFHLVCDATSDAALSRLRERKNRFEQPFAVMARDLAAVRQIAEVNEEEGRLLLSRERPIVLLRKLAASALSEQVAPGNGYIGVMLPYSPLHHLLIRDRPLVMTSANPSGEPIVRENEEARRRLSHIADAFLTHNRGIEVVCDDSVVRMFEGREMPLRRSRGYAPLPVRLPHETRAVLAVGADLKATFCLTKGHYAYLSQHIGDMGTLETQEAFERALEHMLRLFRVTPERVVCDLHPGYLSSLWARRFGRERGIELVEVQHHHAHVASLVAEAGLPMETAVIGVACDGTGYGTDGKIWGGEVLLASGRAFERFAHLPYVALAGGDASVKTPARTALSYLHAAGLAWDDDLPCVQTFSATERSVLKRQLERRLNCVDSSSMGRLFDAVAALIGVRQRVSYEGQAAIELEALCGEETRSYDFDTLLPGVIEDLRAGVPATQIATGFHDAMARWVLDRCLEAHHASGLSRVALTGGVFQNMTLLTRAAALLRQANFEVLTHRRVPANDGGLALGQAYLAAAH
jgi:hydrogenase maturation protein HypF